MSVENEEVVVDTQNNEGEGEANNDVITLSKSDYEKMNQTLGSLKRELKDLKKPKEETRETSTTNKSDESVLLREKLDRMALRQAGLNHPDDIELAQKTAKKWGVDIDEVLTDEDFKVKLERQQTGRANVDATSDIKGSGTASKAKQDPAYWIAKGVPPTAQDVPDRKVRAQIARAMLGAAKNTGKFYNE